MFDWFFANLGVIADVVFVVFAVFGLGMATLIAYKCCMIVELMKMNNRTFRTHARQAEFYNKCRDRLKKWHP